jgi:hypothetical protein
MDTLKARVLEFAGSDNEFYTRFEDYINHYKTEKEGKNNLYFDKTVSLSEKDNQLLKSYIKEIEKFSNTPQGNIALSQYVTNPNVVWACFAIVSNAIDMVLADTLIQDIGMIADIRTGGFGDSFKFDITPRDLFAVSKTGHGKRNAFVQKQFKGTQTIVPENRQISVGVSLYRVLTGAESLGSFIMKAIRSLETQILYDAYDLFETTMDALPTSGTNALKIAGYTQAALVGLAQKVTAWNGNKQAVVLGTKLALANVMPDFTGSRAMLDSEYATLGYIRTLSGFDVAELAQVADYTTEFSTKINNSRLWVISPTSDKIIKVCLEGNTLAYADVINSNANLTQVATINKSYGVGAITSAIAGVITL